MEFPSWLPENLRPVGPELKRRGLLLDPWLRAVDRFMHIEAASGFLLLGCTFFALFLANSPWADAYAAIWETKFGFKIGDYELFKPILLWINDGLMTIFFFVVGLEIKRELVAGELRDVRKVMLPAAAALGGMVAPALIYLLIAPSGAPSRGWGIPMATDIAFVAGFLSLLGPRVPFSLKILLLTLAIVDDIGAILVIAVAYTAHTSIAFLVIGAIGFAIVYLVRWIGVRPVPVYIILGAAVWFAFLKSGVHPTVAGVVLGLLTPSGAWFIDRSLAKVAAGVAERFHNNATPDEEQRDKEEREAAELLARTAKESISPLDRLESALHPWVAFLIMPLFALANAGVKIELSAVANPVALAVAAGLAFGKPIGILAFSWVAIRLGLARLPSGVNWRALFGASCLAGIGFTMSLFIAGLALEGELLASGKLGTLLGSAFSAIVGLASLYFFLRPARAVSDAAPEPNAAN